MSNCYCLSIILFILLFHFSFCADVGCQYRTDESQTKDNAPYTDSKYLTSNDEKQNMQSCFSLSHSDLVEGQCCYKKNTTDNKAYCYDKVKSGEIADLICPDDTVTPLKNNCGMALYYQPKTTEICTEVSLVDGVCCYVQTKNHGKVCLRQDKVDEDKKDEITDYMKDYFRNKLKINDPDNEIEKVYCNGNYIKFYGMLLLLLAVIC